MIQNKIYFKTSYINFMQNSLSDTKNRDDRGYLMAYFDNSSMYTAPKDSQGLSNHYKVVIGGVPLEIVQHKNLYIYALHVIEETESIQESTYSTNTITDDPYDDTIFDNYINLNGKVSLVQATYNADLVQHPVLPIKEDTTVSFSDPNDPYNSFYYNVTDSLEHLKRVVWNGIPMGQTQNGSLIMVKKDITGLTINEEKYLMLNGCPIKTKCIGTKWYLCINTV